MDMILNVYDVSATCFTNTMYQSVKKFVIQYGIIKQNKDLPFLCLICLLRYFIITLSCVT